MDTRRQKRWIALVIILVVIGALFLNQRLAEIDRKLSELTNLQHNIQQLNHSVHDVAYEVDHRLNEWTMNQMWIQEKSLDIKAIDTDDDIAQVELEWSLRELDHEEEIVLSVREKNAQQWEEHPVTSQNGLHFTHELRLAIDRDYDIQMKTNSMEKQKMEKLFDLNVKDLLDSRVDIYGHIVQMNDRDRYYLNVMVHESAGMFLGDIMLEQAEPVTIKQATVYIEVNGDVYEEIDLMKESQDSLHKSVYEYSNDVSIEADPEDVIARVIVIDHLGWEYEATLDVH